jgi:serine-type D-Ala-D-Ala carboxypeptidase (penicillin-binding protein 5/6)
MSMKYNTSRLFSRLFVRESSAVRAFSKIAKTLFGGLLLFALLSHASAQGKLSGSAPAAISAAPTVTARSGVLIDATTGTLLYAKNPDILLPPASLTKLITLHIVYDEIAAGRLSPDELVEIDARDCSPAVPYGSSIMYLHPKMKVSVRDLMLGAAVVSGNDAAYSLARRISGSNEAFAVRMNAEVKALGFDRMTFVEPSGLSELNLVSARQFALFCRDYLQLHPQAIAELHSVKSIDFPRAEHAAPGFVPQGRIIQYNRNPLIFSYPGADGLKTGYIIEVGFNMAATAKRDDTRFISVSLGGTGSSYQRTRDTTRMLDWAFANFTTASIDPGAIPSPRVWFGKKRNVVLVPATANAVTIPKSQLAQLSQRLEAPQSIDGPVQKQAKIGKLIYSLNGKDIATIDLVAAEAVPKGNIFRCLWDGISKFFTNVFKKKAASVRT